MTKYKITSSKYFILKQVQHKFPAILFLLCFMLYGNTLRNEYAFDDPIYTTGNTYIVKGFSAFKDIFDKGSLAGVSGEKIKQYRPLTLLNFMAEVSLFGFNPHVSHFFNVLFFAFTVVSLYFFLKKILIEAKHSTLHYKQEIIIAATLLFAFHPIHTEVVANIKSRDEILGLLFGLLSFYFLMLYEEKNEAYLFYFISLTAFFAALFCKENCLTFVAIIPLLLYFFTVSKTRDIIFKTIPYIILTGIYLFIRSSVLHGMAFTSQISLLDNALMATNSGADRLATAFVLLGKYIYMTIIPYPLSYDYSYNQIPIVSWGNIKSILSLLVCVILIVFMLSGFKKKSIYAFLIALFFITLSLSCNLFVKISSTFSERFLYVPSLAFCIALPVFIERMKNEKKRKFFILHSSFFILLLFYALTVIPRNAVWKNTFTLASSGVITSPNSGRTHKMLAVLLIDSAENSTIKAEKAHYYSAAVHQLMEATKFFNIDPDCFYSLGLCYTNERNYDSAIIAYKKTIEIEPEYTMASNNLGVTYLNLKQFNMALPYLIKSYNDFPGNMQALFNIIICCQQEGNFYLALHYDSLVLKKNPQYIPTALHDMAITHNNIGVQYLRHYEFDYALKEFSIALSIDSNLVVALKNMGFVYEKKGNTEMAKKYTQKAAEKANQPQIN